MRGTIKTNPLFPNPKDHNAHLTDARQRAAPALVIGSYSDREAGRLALRAPRRAGFRHTAAVHGLPNGQSAVEGYGPHPLVVGGVGGVIGVAIASAFLLLVTPVGSWPDSAAIAIAASLVALGALLGTLASRWLVPRVRPSTIRRFQRWVTSGETLVAVELGTGRAREPGNSWQDKAVHKNRKGLEMPSPSLRNESLSGYCCTWSVKVAAFGHVVAALTAVMV